MLGMGPMAADVAVRLDLSIVNALNAIFALLPPNGGILLPPTRGSADMN